MVLTAMEYAESDTDKKAYVRYESATDSETLKPVGAKQKISLDDGDSFQLDDNYSPVSWEVSFFTKADYDNYMKSQGE